MAGRRNRTSPVGPWYNRGYTPKHSSTSSCSTNLCHRALVSFTKSYVVALLLVLNVTTDVCVRVIPFSGVTKWVDRSQFKSYSRTSCNRLENLSEFLPCLQFVRLNVAFKTSSCSWMCISCDIFFRRSPHHVKDHLYHIGCVDWKSFAMDELMLLWSLARCVCILHQCAALLPGYCSSKASMYSTVLHGSNSCAVDPS